MSYASYSDIPGDVLSSLIELLSKKYPFPRAGFVGQENLCKLNFDLGANSVVDDLIVERMRRTTKKARGTPAERHGPMETHRMVVDALSGNPPAEQLVSDLVSGKAESLDGPAVPRRGRGYIPGDPNNDAGA